MPPAEKANPNPKSGGKSKGRADGGQTSTIEFGLPQSMMTALQAISARATQDLWGITAYSSDLLTAEQIAQRRSTATGKLSKRIAGNMRAKQELSSALAAWMSQVGQHVVGLIGRVRAISQKVDEDLTVAVQEMREFLVSQPSQATSEQVTQAELSLGPIWGHLQEQEIIRIAAALRAFGTVQSPVTSVTPGMGSALASFSSQATDPGLLSTLLPAGPSTSASDRTSEVSFGEAGGLATATSTTAIGSRWTKRRSTATGHRPAKSPRREPTSTGSPWTTLSTGLTPEGVRRAPSTSIEAEEPELLPDRPMGPRSATSPTWASAWLCLASFAVDQGADLIGELSNDEAQSAFLPLPATEEDCTPLIQQAEQTWLALKDCVAAKGEKDIFPVCLALYQTLQSLRQQPQAVPRVRQGLILAAHLTVGGLLDPYSYAPATLQEWLHPALLIEQGGPCKGYLPSAVSSAPEVQGLLSLPCPFADQLAAVTLADDSPQSGPLASPSC